MLHHIYCIKVIVQSATKTCPHDLNDKTKSLFLAFWGCVNIFIVECTLDDLSPLKEFLFIVWARAASVSGLFCATTKTIIHNDDILYSVPRQYVTYLVSNQINPDGCYAKWYVWQHYLLWFCLSLWYKEQNILSDRNFGP